MELTGREVHEKQFNDAWRGYNQEEVDDFLDRVAEALDQLGRENAALKTRMAELDQAVAASRDTEEMLKKTLVSAQRAAEEAIATAKAKAEHLINQAEMRAQRAAEEASKRTADAEREYAQRKQQLDASIDRLRAFEADLRKRLKGFLEQQQLTLETLNARPQPGLKATPSTGSPDETPEAAQAQVSEAGGQVRAFSWRPDKAR
jgi:cell division initiation protein